MDYSGIKFVFLLASLACLVQGQKHAISEVVKFSNKFIPKIMKYLGPDHENMVFSPFGIATNLVMALEAVNPKLPKNVSQNLGLENERALKNILRVGFKALNEKFEAEQRDEETAGSFNRALLHSAIPLQPEYKEVLEKFYRANITQDNGNSTAQVLELQSDAGVISHWKDYEKSAAFTYLKHRPADPFTDYKGETIRVSMIPQYGLLHAGYLPKLRSQAVELQLENPDASLILIMPDYKDSISELIYKIPIDTVGYLTDILPLTDTEVSLPQLAIILKDMDFKNFFIDLGLQTMFDSTRNGKFRGPLKYVKQNAYFTTSFVSVNSVGATGSVLYKKISPKRPKRQVSTKMVFNRPFLFFLIHRSSGLVLLCGMVKSPSEVPK